jgi:tRNA threonylcarbamoyladenosine dehydratase
VHRFSRTEWLIGKDAVDKLSQSTVAVFGIGGVGSYVVEGLARAGVGRLVLVDNSNIHLTNLNRQIHAVDSTIGRAKVEVMKDRILSVNPTAEVITHKVFYHPEVELDVFTYGPDYVVDAMDTVAAKTALIIKAKQKGILVISSMGTGNKLNPLLFEVADIYDTSVCPLARVMRKEMRKHGIDELKVVYSKEERIKPVRPDEHDNHDSGWKPGQTPGSVPFVPSVAGLIIAGEVVKDIILWRHG